MNEYDAIDFGCATGNTVRFIQEAFGAKKVLGIDRRGVHRKDAERLGFEFMKADVMDDFLGEDCARFVTMGHFLEHLENLTAVEDALRYALEAATEFVYASNPAWDCVERLRRNGLKFYWQEWADHTAHVTTKEVHRILSRELCVPHTIFASGMIRSAADPDIHPLESPGGVAHYNKAEHPPKDHMVFAPDIFKEMTVFAWRDRQAWLRWRPVVERMYTQPRHRVMYEEIPA